MSARAQLESAQAAAPRAETTKAPERSVEEVLSFA